MKVEKINKKSKKKRILLAPLDWGLGHATRCIPIIRLLIEQDIEVLLAAEGPVASLLEKELPELVILPLKGYGIRYSSSKSFFLLRMMAQVFQVVARIRYEKKWLNEMIIRYEPIALISDNRFGLYTKHIPCVFITHQLFIQTGNNFLNRLAQKINYRYINKFAECWVADAEGRNNLAGKLSHPEILPGTPVKYLGILSRCKKLDLQKETDLLILISGPEPQRTVFENILLEQLKSTDASIVFLRGLPAATGKLTSEKKNLSIFNHLPADELNMLVQKAKLVLARCGYSTVMDLVSLKQKAILVPTPGQAEQEYLAKYLKEKKIFYTTKQENFSLAQEMKNADSFEFMPFDIPSTLNRNVILDWLEKI